MGNVLTPTADRGPTANLLHHRATTVASRTPLVSSLLIFNATACSILMAKRKQRAQKGGQTQADSLAEVMMEMKGCILTVGIPAHIFCQMIFIQLRGVC